MKVLKLFERFLEGVCRRLKNYNERIEEKEKTGENRVIGAYMKPEVDVRLKSKTKSSEKPMPPERCYLKYQLNLRNIKYEAIAKKANRSAAFISMVVCGVRRSKKVEAVLANVLGFPSWEHLWADSKINAERKDV